MEQERRAENKSGDRDIAIAEYGKTLNPVAQVQRTVYARVGYPAIIPKP